MLNQVALQGRLTRDPELRQTPSCTAVASFTLACERDFTNSEGQRETDFVDCVAWRQTADFVTRYFFKGQMAVVAGRLQVRSYQTQDGSKRKVAEVVVSSVYFCGPKQDSGSAYADRQQQPQGSVPPPTELPQQSGSDYDEDDDELPF